LVANRDAFNTHEATLLLRGVTGVDRMDKTTGKWQVVKTTTRDGRLLVKLPLEEGSGELLRVRRPK
ncbi:MAG: hypothetical protein IIA67_11580, partial [Planctomycetes bacterium]|nr:hypothetical protein [Planctomycetota bacterium]